MAHKNKLPVPQVKRHNFPALRKPIFLKIFFAFVLVFLLLSSGCNSGCNINDPDFSQGVIIASLVIGFIAAIIITVFISSYGNPANCGWGIIFCIIWAIVAFIVLILIMLFTGNIGEIFNSCN